MWRQVTRSEAGLAHWRRRARRHRRGPDGAPAPGPAGSPAGIPGCCARRGGRRYVQKDRNPTARRVDRARPYHRQSMQTRAFAQGPGGAAGEKSLVPTIDWPGADPDVGVESSGRAGPCAPPAELRQGYHCACWSNRYSDSGRAKASQSGTASASPSSHAGGPCAGAIGGGSAGSPR
jgi:hypothetical protein